MDNICAIVDAQGFMSNGEFVIRELAMLRIDDNYIRSWDVETPIKTETMSNRDKITNEYLRTYHTGLDWKIIEEKPIAYEKIRAFLAFLHNHAKSEDRERFGIKNPQFGNILSDLSIPYTELKTPSYSLLMKHYKSTVFCLRHVHKMDGVCAVQKVDHMHTHLTDSKDFNKTIHTYHWDNHARKNDPL